MIVFVVSPARAAMSTKLAKTCPLFLDCAARLKLLGGSLSLAPDRRPAAAGVETLVLGFRPEGACLTSPEEDGALRGTVYVTEEIGNETFVFLKCEEALVTVRAEAHFNAEIGDVLGVKVPPSSVRLFDARTGNSIDD